MKRFFIILLYLVAFMMLSLAAFLIIFSIKDYRPPPVQSIFSSDDEVSVLDTGQVMNMITWNIGYAGLGKDMDFFYDGGSRVRTEYDTFHRNLQQIVQLMQMSEDVDFLLLQEVDTDAKRSFGVNQLQAMRAKMNNTHFVFAKNYDVAFVPVPPGNPRGKVVSGLVSISLYKPFEALRYSFPGNYAWPKHLFLLDRCFLLSRFKVADGRDLVIINTHNSAFDNGSLREEQLGILVHIMTDEFSKGNYVIAGGDWNMNPPGFAGSSLQTGDAVMFVEPAIGSGSFPQGWIVAFDPTVPTNRDLSTPYLHGSTPVTIIDFFVCSPNVEVIEIEGFSAGFELSDHNPVGMRFVLK